MHETPEDIVAALQQRWAAAFNRHDPDDLAALYTEDGLLFGGKPALSRGRSGVRSYFAAVSATTLVDNFGEQAVVRLGPDAIASAGFLTFVRDGIRLPYRISLTLLRVGDGWKIASHHASPVPGLPA